MIIHSLFFKFTCWRKLQSFNSIDLDRSFYFPPLVPLLSAPLRRRTTLFLSQTFSKNPSRKKHTSQMCRYYKTIADCGHLILLSGSSCQLVYQQFQRINDPLNHYWPLSEDLPFQVPDSCLPNVTNVQPAPIRDSTGGLGIVCSVECQNNSPYGRRVGEPDAHYGPGSERKNFGFGWRQQDTNTIGPWGGRWETKK